MAKDKLTDHWTMQDKKVVRISRKKVEQALVPIDTFASHLDLEGFCYIKLVRTGPHECFAQDVTSMILKGEEPQGFKNMTYKDMQESLWKKPAMVKWAEPIKKEKA